MRLKLISDAAQLAELRRGWSTLVGKAADANTFLTPEWILSWWESYLPAAEIRSLAAFDGDRLVGLAPMMMTRESRTGVPVRCLRFIGDGSNETDHMNFVVDSDFADQTRQKLLEGIAEIEWDVAVFCNVPASSGTTETLADWAASNRFFLSHELSPGPLRSLPASFDEVLASMPSRFRTSVRSTRRKLGASYRIEFGLHDRKEEFGQALQALFTNHESRWKARGQTGVFVNDKRRRFYSELTHRLHESGDLRFFYLKLDDRIVAQEYCFQHRGVVYLLQEGFDFALAKENIGNALRSYVFEYLINEGYKTYDFLAGVTRHKMNWSNATAHDVTLSLARPSVRGSLAFHGPRAIEKAKSALRPIRDALLRREAAARVKSAENVET